jgi:serine/threonine protein kinase
MKICRKCGAKYPDHEEICSVDGHLLHPLPDFLANRQSRPPASSKESRDSDPFIGKNIEKYKVIRKIGEGGMGVVYEAEHIHIQKKVALKILREDYTRKQDVVERFKQEARSASIIGHPNIIDVTDFGYTHNGRVFFVMEYLDGEDLATILENERTISFRRAVKIARQVCNALTAAHDKGIIHRDMKPENIFLQKAGTKDEKVKILDFGIAKMSILDQEGRKLTKTGIVFGTPEYMSPEQAAGKPVDRRIDIYSLGIILFEMLTGKVPFTGDTFMAILSKHIFEKVPSLKESARNLAIPLTLESVIYKCLDKEPDRRFQSADELRDALDAISRDEDITLEVIEPVPVRHAPAATTPGPVLEVVGDGDMGTRRSRLPLVILTVSLALVSLAAISGFVYVKMTRSEGGEPSTQDNYVVTGFSEDGETEKHPFDDEEDGAGGSAADGGKVEDGSLGMLPQQEMVQIRIVTNPDGAVVEATGQGQVCPTTPCEFQAPKGVELTLLVQRGKHRQEKTITPEEDPTELHFKLGKADKKPSMKANGDKEKGPDKDKSQGSKTKKIKNIDSGELKTPEIFKDK